LSRFRTGTLKKVTDPRRMPQRHMTGRLCQSVKDMTLCKADSVLSVDAERFLERDGVSPVDGR